MAKIRFCVPCGKFDYRKFHYIPMGTNIEISNTGISQIITMDVKTGVIKTLKNDLTKKYGKYHGSHNLNYEIIILS